MVSSVLAAQLQQQRSDAVQARSENGRQHLQALRAAPALTDCSTPLHQNQFRTLVSDCLPPHCDKVAWNPDVCVMPM